jgi:signal transduction histidine kinase
MLNLEPPNVREEEWEPWLHLISLLHPYRSWDRFCDCLIRNLELLTGAQRISILYRVGSAEVQSDQALGRVPGGSVLPEEVGQVRTRDSTTYAMIYNGAKFAAWLSFVDAGRWNLAEILARVSLPIGQLVARVRCFEDMRSALGEALSLSERTVGGLAAVTRDNLAKLLAASARANQAPTILLTREAPERFQATWWEGELGLQSVPITMLDVLNRVEDAIEDAQDVSLRASVAEQFAAEIGATVGGFDWFYFVPLRSFDAVVGLLGTGLSLASLPPGDVFQVGLLGQDLAGFPRASGRRMQQAQAVERLRLITDVLGQQLSQADLREAAFTDGITRERGHLGIDLHDSILQDLTYLQLQLGRLDGLMTEDPERAKTVLAQVQSQLQMTSREARELAVGLTTGETSSHLPDVLEPVVDRFRTRFDGRVDFRSGGMERPSPASTNTQVMRILQELLNNVWKHAAASRVSVDVSYEKDHIRLTVVDNGRGFVTEDRSQSQLGLRGLQERAQEVGATVDFNSDPGKGTTVTVRIPA